MLSLPRAPVALAVVVPVYQGADTFDELLAELTAVLNRITPDYDIVFVDDGSADGAWERIAGAAARDGRIRGLRMIRNFGEHVAVTAGLDQVDAEHTVLIACDLQDDPAAIPAMIAQARAGCDLVLTRRLQRQDAWFKRTLARLFYAAIAVLTHVKYDYRVGNYRLLSRHALHYFREHRERSRNVNAIMVLMGLRTGYVDVPHRARRRGRSSYTLGRSARMAASVILGYSEIPLLLSGVVGLVLLAGGILTGVSMWLAARGGAVPSAAGLVLVALGGIGGLLLINLGIVGAYIGRAATEARGRPLYYVDATTSTSSPGER